ncbi:MAG: hypothetical protein R3C13_08630 [Hyphomonas sp.]|uniref:hypothetical protein n=1 Tax=Hyphomonas sp. TaxID=87 RepID=UPI003529B2AE
MVQFAGPMDAVPPKPALDRPSEIGLSPKRVAIGLILIGAFLFTAQAFVLVMKYGFDREYLFGLAAKFHLNKEMNVPTVTSTLILVGCAAMLSVNALLSPKGRRAAWWLLAAVFLFLGYDESMQIHEMLSGSVHRTFQADWVPAFAWVLPYGAAIIVLAVVLLPWFLALDRASQISFFLAGVIYVGGALGIELLEGMSFSSIDQSLSVEGLRAANHSLPHELLTTTQECMEYIGSAFFLYLLVKRVGGLRLVPGPGLLPQAAS